MRTGWLKPVSVRTSVLTPLHSCFRGTSVVLWRGRAGRDAEGAGGLGDGLAVTLVERELDGVGTASRHLVGRHVGNGLREAAVTQVDRLVGGDGAVLGRGMEDGGLAACHRAADRDGPGIGDDNVVDRLHLEDLGRRRCRWGFGADGLGLRLRGCLGRCRGLHLGADLVPELGHVD